MRYSPQKYLLVFSHFFSGPSPVFWYSASQPWSLWAAHRWEALDSLRIGSSKIFCQITHSRTVAWSGRRRRELKVNWLNVARALKSIWEINKKNRFIVKFGNVIPEGLPLNWTKFSKKKTLFYVLSSVCFRIAFWTHG